MLYPTVDIPQNSSAFLRASAEPPRRFAPAGSRLSRFPAGVSAVLLHISFTESRSKPCAERQNRSPLQNKECVKT